jgi:hypothetical protein
VNDVLDVSFEIIKFFKKKLFILFSALRFEAAWAEDRAILGRNWSAAPGPKLHAVGEVKLSHPSLLRFSACKFGFKAIKPITILCHRNYSR